MSLVCRSRCQTSQWVFRVPGAPREQPVVQDQAVFYAPPLPGPTAPAMETRIRAAAGMRWSPASHAAFPSDFRAAAGALLCCHQRLAACRSSAATSTDATERRGCWLRHLSRQLSAQGAPACKRVGQGKGAAQRHQQSCCLGDLTKARREGDPQDLTERGCQLLLQHCTPQPTPSITDAPTICRRCWHLQLRPSAMPV